MNNGIMIYDFPIARVSFNSTTFNYALVAQKLVLPCMEHQEPDRIQGRAQAPGIATASFLRSCIPAKRSPLVSTFPGIQGARNPPHKYAHSP